MSEQPMPRLQESYYSEILPALRESLGLKNGLAVPRLEKIVVNMGVGRAVENRKRLDEAIECLGKITGQKPVVCRARRSVSAFRLREGQEIGCKVTLRRARMFEFLDRLVSLVFPRIRDFRGLPETAFDGRGNYTVGIAEVATFPEIDPSDIEFNQGMDITFVISGDSDAASRELLLQFGLPLRRPAEQRAAS